MDEYGLRRACQWAGNSPATAMKNYALVRKTDFADDGNSVNKPDAKSDADSASPGKTAPRKTQQKKHREELESSNGADQWTILDLNPPLKPESYQLLTQKRRQIRRHVCTMNNWHELSLNGRCFQAI